MKSKKTGKKIWDTSVMLIGSIFVLSAGMLFSSPLLDKLSVKGWQCQIISAETRDGNGGLRGSVTTAAIAVETSNCGKIYITGQPANSINSERTIADLKPGSEWIFETGWYTRNIHMKVWGSPPSAKSFRLVEN